MGWAASEAARITEAESKLQRSREWQLHVAELIRAEGLNVFNRQAERIEQYVKEFNSAHGDAALGCTRKPDKISVVKEQSPFVSLQLHHNGTRVLVELTRLKNYVLDKTTWDIWYQTNSDGSAVFLGSEDYDQAAKDLLSIVLRNYFGSVE